MPTKHTHTQTHTKKVFGWNKQKIRRSWRRWKSNEQILFLSAERWFSCVCFHLDCIWFEPPFCCIAFISAVIVVGPVSLSLYMLSHVHVQVCGHVRVSNEENFPFRYSFVFLSFWIILDPLLNICALCSHQPLSSYPYKFALIIIWESFFCPLFMHSDASQTVAVCRRRRLCMPYILDI